MSRALGEMSLPCPHDICDGSGFVEEGVFDEKEEKECLCRIEKKREEMANS